MRRTDLDGVAKYLDINRETAWRWAWDGYLPSIKLGRPSGNGARRRYHYRFDLDDVDSWLDGQKHDGRPTRIPEVELA
jgi:hypothetical protein